jgi:hypothetical protein
MRGKILLTGAVLAWLGWFALGPMNQVLAAGPQAGYQVAQNEHHNGHHNEAGWDHHNKDHDNEWYQGQQGRWSQGPNHKWQWQSRDGNDWYWGQRGHWYKEQNGWQFGSAGLVCDNNGRNCRYGRYLPPNGQGMVNRKNPNLYWHCDSEGNHCNWARRPR